jgi:hypothetical protein
MSDQNTVPKIMAKAMHDAAFRQQLLSHPRATLEGALGVTLPPDLTIQVHEDTPTAIHLVLPSSALRGDTGALAEATLGAVAGGVHCISSVDITTKSYLFCL